MFIRLKILETCAILLLIGLIHSCNKSVDIVSGNAEVKAFVVALKDGNYDSLNLPAFNEDHIPALLGFRHERSLINEFPRNPISSFYQQDVALGVYILWTIESIRIQTDGDQLILRFPSQNPLLVTREITDFDPITDETSQRIIANAYQQWWEENQNQNFAITRQIDPLINTPYRWH